MIPLDSGSRQEGLDAAAQTAKAGSAGSFVVRRPRQRIVTPFAGDRIRTDEHLAAHDDACADAGAENRAEDDLRAACRAVGSLGKREAIGVVGDPDLAREQQFEVRAYGLAVEAD